MTGITKTTEYKKFIREIKSRIQTSQIKAAVKVNVELLRLYWDIAQLIVGKQKQSAWGDGLLSEVSKDLTREFPGMKGFSPTNLKYMHNWYLFYSNENRPQLVEKIETHANRPQLVDDLRKNDFSPVISTIFQIPWGHNREIITKCKTVLDFRPRS